jgi:hypothetical protein
VEASLRIGGGSQLKSKVLMNGFPAFQKTTGTNTPANFHNLAIVTQRTLRQSRRGPIEFAKIDVVRWLSSLEVVHANVFITLSFGVPHDRQLDSRQIGAINGVNLTLKRDLIARTIIAAIRFEPEAYEWFHVVGLGSRGH